MTATDPKKVTLRGLLSFPTYSAQEAYERSQKGQYPAADVGSAAPSFQLLVDETQFEKFLAHVRDEFLPYCIQQDANGEKKDALTKKEVEALLEGLEGDLTDQLYNTPAKAVHEKTAPLAPDAVASLKLIGPKGGVIDQKAVVLSEDELAVPDPDIVNFPIIKPIGQTVHELYPGCVVAVTARPYAYHNGKHPGFSLGCSTVVYYAAGERFGGGTDVDEAAIFAD